MHKEKRNSIDLLKMIACIGIVVMHIRYNISYEIPGDLFVWIINSFDDFVFLFMAISSFGLCCGYYHAFEDGSINWESFYKRRFAKILPFFITMILLDLCMSFSFDSFMQALVESTLFHGFIPVEFSVIGVGWFLGIIFIFYMSFPFFCILLKNKKTAWLALLIALGLNMICQYHFDISRRNFAFSFCYFLIGGLIYLYKDKIEQSNWWHFIIIILSVVLYYFSANTITRVLLTASILAFAVSLNIKPIKPVSFISSISMEIYLCHMVIYRAFEKMNVFEVFGGGIVQYLMTCFVVFLGACIMSVIVKFVLEKLSEVIKKWDLIIALFAVIIFSCGCCCGYFVIKNESNQNQLNQEINASIPQLSEAEPVPSEEDIERKNEDYNYLAIGNSITLHGIESIWWNEIGMAASYEDHDYFHLVLKYLEENNNNVKGIPFNFVEWEIESQDRAKTLNSLDQYLDSELDLVTIQLGENVRDLTTYAEDYVSLINYVKEKAPKARILVIEDFWSDEYSTELEKTIAEKTGVDFVSLEGITNNSEYFCGLNTIVYDKDGGEHIVEEVAVANHPGDKGMAAIASRIIEVLKAE